MTANPTGTSPSLVRRVIYTATMGLVTFAISQAFEGPLGAPLAEQIALSTLVGGITLLVQFLRDFEQQIARLELQQEDNLRRIRLAIDSGFASVSEATRFMAEVENSPLNTNVLTALVHAAGRMSATRPKLITDLGHYELERVTVLLRSLGDGNEVFYDGEDREWLLGLARSARTSIDATSLATVDAGPTSFESGLWMNDLGGRYLDLQRAATARGVRIRRIFVFDSSPGLDPGDFEQICQLQHSSGVEVRRLDSETVPPHLKNLIFDFVLFDGVLSYETTPATRMDVHGKPAIVTTRLVLNPERVHGRRDRFEALWNVSKPVLSPPSLEPSRLAVVSWEAAQANSID
jgi:hypothetical protein